MRSLSYFGKLPAFGDFIQEKMPSRLSRLWEPWLEAGMRISRQRLDDAWMDYYLNGPIWRFLLGPGLVDQNYYAGLLVPSMDQVGRYFPFSVFLPIVPEEILDFSFFQTRWFNALESAVLHQLELDQATKASLLDSLYSTMSVLDQPTEYSYSPEKSVVISAQTPNELSSGYLALIMSQLSDRSLWWTEGGQKTAPATLLTPTWPSEDIYTALLDGRWNCLEDGVQTVSIQSI